MPGSATGREPRSYILHATLLGGAIAGILDIADAFVFTGVRSGVSPVRVLQYIASGLIGPSAFTGGAATAALGLALHFFIATTAAAVYALAGVRLPILIRRPFLCGPVFGLGVHLVMQTIVIPRSLVPPPGRPSLVGFANQIFAHIVCVGLPIAWATRRAALR